jgi:Capsule assembly protein Wzi
MKLPVALVMKLLAFVVTCVACSAHAQTPASVSYTPTWQARHHLQLLADEAGLPMTVTHWPLPAAAVQQALEQLVLPPVADADVDADADADAAEASRRFVLNELAALRSRGRVLLHARTAAEGLPAFGERYTPGSSVQLSSPEGRWAEGDVSVAGRLGVSLEANANAMPVHWAGAPNEAAHQWRVQGTEAVLAWGGWHAQVFSRQNWWGPGWQSSMVNGHNSPAWTGAGVQRGSVQPSDSPWLSWLGPWNLEVFVAQAQDPMVVKPQASGFLFSGMRLTMKPKPWLELGLSRGLQTGGAGRPGGLRNFAKAFLGQEVNQFPGDPPDSSGQIAGFDVRAACPAAWGSCAGYMQAMGEDAASKGIPLPIKFMMLWGAEKTFDHGRYRVFAEWMSANAFTAPWERGQSFPGYINGVYTQGYTQGARWAGPAAGAGARVMTLGWMDAQEQRQLKLHKGEVATSIGTYSPTLDAPHGHLWALSASQSWPWKGMTVTPELSYTHLSQGTDQGVNKRTNLRAGLLLTIPL